MDAQRQATRVTLYDVQRGGTFNPDLFDFVAPTQPARAASADGAHLTWKAKGGRRVIVGMPVTVGERRKFVHKNFHKLH